MIHKPGIFACDSLPPTPLLPSCTGDFTYEPENPKTSTPVTFVAKSENGTFVKWDFGDGTMDVDGAFSTMHTFGRPGMYPVKMIVDCEGGQQEVYHEIEVVQVPTHLKLSEIIILSLPLQSGFLYDYPDIYIQIINDSKIVFETAEEVKVNVEPSDIPFYYSPGVIINPQNPVYTIRVWDQNIRAIKDDEKLAEFRVVFNEDSQYTEDIELKNADVVISLKILVEEEPVQEK